MEFVCKYAKPTGEVVRVVQVGQNADEVRHHLQEQGFLPISVQPRGWTLASGITKRAAKIDPQDFIVFNQQFVALIKAGLPILRSLDLLKVQIAVSTAVQQNLVIAAPAVVALVVGIIVWAGTSGGRNRIDEFKLRAPIIGHLWTMFSMAQLSRTLSTLLQGGIPLLAALEV